MNNRAIKNLKNRILGDIRESWEEKELELANKLGIKLFNYGQWLLDHFTVREDGYTATLKYKDGIESRKAFVEDLEDGSLLLVVRNGRDPIIISNGNVSKTNRKTEVSVFVSCGSSLGTYARIKVDGESNPSIYVEPGTVLTKKEAIEKGLKTFTHATDDNCSFLYELLNE